MENKTNIDNDFATLSNILNSAYKQAAIGKGIKRHGEPGIKIEDQTVLKISHLVKGAPHAGPLFQVLKKAIESTRLTPEAAIHELLGVINYAAFCIIILREERIELDTDAFRKNHHLIPCDKNGKIL